MNRLVKAHCQRLPRYDDELQSLWDPRIPITPFQLPARYPCALQTRMGEVVPLMWVNYPEDNAHTPPPRPCEREAIGYVPPPHEIPLSRASARVLPACQDYELQIGYPAL